MTVLNGTFVHLYGNKVRKDIIYTEVIKVK